MNPFSPIIPPPLPEVAAAHRVAMAGNQLLQILEQQYTLAYELVWNNKQAAAAKIIAALGPQAANVFTRSAQLAAFINAQGGSVPAGPPAGWTVTFDTAGAATAAYTAPVAH